MTTSRIVLISIYALNALGLLGAIFLGDPAGGGAKGIGGLLVVAFSVVTILALAGKAGKPARSGAFAFDGLVLILGIGSTIISAWLLSTGDADMIFELAAGILFAIIGWSTIAVLRKRTSSGETQQLSKSEKT